MKQTLTLLAIGTLFSINAFAQPHLEKQLESVGATNVSIHPSALPNFKTALSDQGVVHISDDGRFVIYGKVFEINNGKVTEITNQVLLSQLEDFSHEMIVYPAKQPKHVITVFMDISCHYCQVLHKKIKEYNELGITIRYLAFPRGGMNTQTAKQMESIWTAKDKRFALDEAEKGELPKVLKTPDIVKKHYQLGLKFGVTGTPAIITQTGELIPGFVEPQALLTMLEN